MPHCAETQIESQRARPARVEVGMEGADVQELGENF